MATVVNACWEIPVALSEIERFCKFVDKNASASIVVTELGIFISLTSVD